MYRGRLHSGEEVAVKVQRPFVLETVTVDLFLVRYQTAWPSVHTCLHAVLLVFNSCLLCYECILASSCDLAIGWILMLHAKGRSLVSTFSHG